MLCSLHVFLYTALQMITLVWLLPFMIECHIPQSDENWECFLLLRDICNTTSAFEVTESDVLKLAWMVETYLESYPTLHTTALTPKFHCLLHLPNQMLRKISRYVHITSCTQFCIVLHALLYYGFYSHTHSLIHQYKRS